MTKTPTENKWFYTENGIKDASWHIVFKSEVLAPVPSYDEWKRLQERNKKLEKMAFHYTPEEWNTMLKMVERLQKQLKEANELIALLYPLSMNKERALERTVDYMEKWGVK